MNVEKHFFKLELAYFLNWVIEYDKNLQLLNHNYMQCDSLEGLG